MLLLRVPSLLLGGEAHLYFIVKVGSRKKDAEDEINANAIAHVVIGREEKNI